METEGLFYSRRFVWIGLVYVASMVVVGQGVYESMTLYLPHWAALAAGLFTGICFPSIWKYHGFAAQRTGTE